MGIPSFKKIISIWEESQMIKIIGLFGLEGPNQKVLFTVAPFTKFFTVFFILKGEAKSPPPQFDTHTKKISQPSENLPWTNLFLSRTPYSSGCIDIPKYSGHIPAPFPRKHKDILHQNIGEWAVSQCNGCIYSFRGCLCFAGSLQKKWKQYVEGGI